MATGCITVPGLEPTSTTATLLVDAEVGLVMAGQPQSGLKIKMGGGDLCDITKKVGSGAESQRVCDPHTHTHTRPHTRKAHVPRVYSLPVCVPPHPGVATPGSQCTTGHNPKLKHARTSPPFPACSHSHGQPP